VPLFDFEEMSKSCLGANWRKATPEQQKEFVDLFSKLLSKTYLAKIRSNVEESSVKFLPGMTKGDRVVVRSIINSRGDDVAADYRMLEKNGQLKIYDVVVENVGLVTNYRTEFNSILRKGDFPELLSRLRNQSIKAKLGSDASA
jgi:phospholipid transport system substrate-binding protein